MKTDQKHVADLQILAPPVSEVDIGGKRLTLSPLVLGELPAMLKAVQPFAQQLQGEPNWLTLLCQHSDAVLRALSIASRCPREWIDALSINDALTLAAAVFEVKADFFYPTSGANTSNARTAPGRALGWAEVIARLIGSGHRYLDILGYTLSQAQAFLAAAQRLEHERLSSQLSLMAVATQGTRSSIRELHAQLLRSANDAPVADH